MFKATFVVLFKRMVKRQKVWEIPQNISMEKCWINLPLGTVW